jgi:Na+-translocating ferredoxin:NAD+ oxidoreductase RnfA subunit
MLATALPLIAVAFLGACWLITVNKRAQHLFSHLIIAMFVLAVLGIISWLFWFTWPLTVILIGLAIIWYTLRVIMKLPSRL